MKAPGTDRASYDLIVIGAGSGGLVAADSAARLGARVALVESRRIGGDCTWTGCVPSKALLRAAGVAHQVRNARRFGVVAAEPSVEMAAVRDHVKLAIDEVYARETPAVLARRGIEVIEGAASFSESRLISVGDRTLRSRRFLICTGAGPSLPPIPGLGDGSFHTYETIFENGRLPGHLVVLGAGPIGLELGLAYRRLGAAVTVVGLELLPGEDPEVRSFVSAQLAREEIRVVIGAVSRVRYEGQRVMLEAGAGTVSGDMLLVATGRAARTDDLGLANAGVAFDRRGITVDRFLRTTSRHIYAAGDCTGGPQFTHYAAWQGFQAVRNALLPGSSAGTTALVPRVTFLDPEIAQLGLAEPEARERYGARLRVGRLPMESVDRATTDGEKHGFIKLLTLRSGRLVGATLVAPHAGEVINEIALAMKHRLGITDLAGSIHAYPTISTGVQQLASEMSVRSFLSGIGARLALLVSGLRGNSGGNGGHQADSGE